MRICVYGAASDNIDEKYKTAAFELGALLGAHGHTLVYGGGATGIMGQTAKGFLSVDGQVIGVAPRFFDTEGVLLKKCTEFIFTETMRERKETMENLSDAFVMAPGGMGTFEEFFEVLTLRQLGRHDKLIFILNTGGYYDPLEKLMQHALDEGFIRVDHHGLYVLCSTPQDILTHLQNR